MAYDEGLAERIRRHLIERNDVEEKKMFGGLCFMISNHMCFGILDDKLMARVGPENYEQSLSRDHVYEMDFTGKVMRGMVYVAPEGLMSDHELAEWITICTNFVESLPKRG